MDFIKSKYFIAIVIVGALYYFAHKPTFHSTLRKFDAVILKIPYIGKEVHTTIFSRYSSQPHALRVHSYYPTHHHRHGKFVPIHHHRRHHRRR